MSKKLKDPGESGFYPVEGLLVSCGVSFGKLRAINTGEKRPPKKGEYYLSGGPVMAYKAPNDLTDSFYIAHLVEVEKVVTYKIIKYL